MWRMRELMGNKQRRIIKDATITVPTTATINNNVSCSHQKNSVTIQSSSLRPSFSTTTTAKIATSKSATTTKNATSTAKNATIKNSSIEYNNYYSNIGSYIFYYKIFIVIFLLSKSSFTASPIASMSSNVKIVSNFSTTTTTNTTKSATSIIKNIDHPNPNPNHHRHRRSIVTKLDTIPEQFIILALLPAENAPLITRALRDGQSKWEISTHKSDYWFNDNDNDKNQTVMATNIQQLRASDLQLTIYSEPIENDTERILQSTCEWIKIHKPAIILSLLDNYRSFYTSLIAEHFQIPFISMTQNYQNEINQILTTTKTTKTTKATTTTKSTTTTTKLDEKGSIDRNQSIDRFWLVG
ncbi:hypothetical protein DERP_003496 [Dermatophagoides pteronyssinus]|uniref:Uncharacterized protein n=1 Tax=Dermatophagoides pteronyssinus TaxID=6956 RepID=A0ABQ8JKS6_DERPT|nr:hypothetical protein DERP_003496 [Dermatophagoides pteronyssinus]